MTLHVNDQVITQAEMDREFNRLREEYENYAQQNGAEPDIHQLRQWVRENLIERALLRQHASTLTPEAEDAGASDERRMERQMTRLVDQIQDTATPPTDEDVAAFYAKHPARFRRQEQVHAAHIVKHTPGGSSDPRAYAEALNIREQIRKGASFETMAQQTSDCPDQAGDLGVFGRGQMVPAFEDVVFGMQPGEISEVFQTPFGYHIAKVYERQEAGSVPLDEVREAITRHLHEERRNEALNNFLDELKSQADIREE